jgi:chromosome segregation ATPase
MNIAETIAYIQSQLQQIEIQEQNNQNEQAATNLRIEELEGELKLQYQRQSELDSEALELYRKAEELKAKLERLTRISSLSQEFKQLQTEFQDNQELLETLYVSVFESAERNERNKYLNINIQDLTSEDNVNDSTSKFSSDADDADDADDRNNPDLSVENIRAALPEAEQIRQQLDEWYSEKFEVHRNHSIDNLSVTWYAVAFIAFGRSLYHKLSRKHHPDRNGSDSAMQLLNTAWEVSEDYRANLLEGSI